MNNSSAKKFNILAFFFAPGYYAGRGEIKKGIIYAILGSIPVVFVISPFVAAIKAKSMKETSFHWGKAIGATLLHLFLVLVVLTALKSA